MFNRYSTNGSPINVSFPKCLQLSPQDFILRTNTGRISIHHFFSNIAHILQQLSVTCYIGNFQVEGNTTLLCAFQITGTS